MFCVNCGTPVREDQNFCPNCGHPVKHAAEAAAPPPRVPVTQATPAVPPVPHYAPVTHASAAPAPPAPAAPVSGRCNWCGAAVDFSQPSCPQCGAALKLPAALSESGWTQVPARKDMAKLQMGHSHCQIEGLYVPVADFNLAAGDSVYFTHHVLLWKEPQVNVTTMSLKGGWKRMFAGLPLIMTQAEGPGRIAFSKDDPGELIPVPLQAGQSLDVREHMLLAATSNVGYDWFQTGIWFETQQGNDTETHYPVGRYMDRFAASQTPGLVLLHAGGNVFVRTLKPRQTILVKPTALVFKDPTVQMQLHFEHPGALFSMWRPWNNRYLWLRLSGPGRVAVQSVFERIEGESRNMIRWSNATAVRW
ncbi:MAG TPA: AIM24 family protein [Bryobacteraceae bacterium]|nr:AIM24 family protein [Bryobacteraceae bacterium]